MNQVCLYGICIFHTAWSFLSAGQQMLRSVTTFCVCVCVFYIKNTICHLTGSAPGAVPVHHTSPRVPLLGFLCACRAHRHSSVPQETAALLTRASVSVCLCVCVSISPHCWGPGWLCRGLAPGTSLGEGCRRSWGFGCLVRTRGKTNKHPLRICI